MKNNQLKLEDCLPIKWAKIKLIALLLFYGAMTYTITLAGSAFDDHPVRWPFTILVFVFFNLTLFGLTRLWEWLKQVSARNLFGYWIRYWLEDGKLKYDLGFHYRTLMSPYIMISSGKWKQDTIGPIPDNINITAVFNLARRNQSELFVRDIFKKNLDIAIRQRKPYKSISSEQPGMSVRVTDSHDDTVNCGIETLLNNLEYYRSLKMMTGGFWFSWVSKFLSERDNAFQSIIYSLLDVMKKKSARYPSDEEKRKRKAALKHFIYLLSSNHPNRAELEADLEALEGTPTREAKAAAKAMPRGATIEI